MKKQIGMTAVLATLMLTVGCQNSVSSNNQSSFESSSRSSKVEKTSTTSSPKSSSNISSSEKSSSFSSSSLKKSSLVDSQAPASKKSRFAKVNSEIAEKFPDLPLPRTSGLDTDSNAFNARYTQSKNKITIYYSVGNQAKKFNAASLKKELPYLVYSQESNLSSEQMSSAINYQKQASGLPTVKLNNGVTATEQFGAG